MSFYASYPTSSVSSNPSVGPNGAPIPTSATLVAGENPSLNLQPLQTDALGNLLVFVSSSGGSPIITKDVADGSVTGGTAGTFSQLAGLVFNTSLPTLTTGQQAALQGDSSGRLITRLLTSTDTVTAVSAVAANFLTTVTQGTSPWVNNISQFGGSNVVTGTGTSGAGIPRVTVSSDSSITASVTQGTSPWVSNITQFGSNNVVTGTGASGVGIPRMTVSNDSNILATQSGSWTVAATQSGGWTVTANIGTTNGLALDATVSTVQGSVTGGTAGTKSSLSGGVFNSSPPSLTNGQQAGLQLDSSGNLKISGSITATNASIGTTGAAVPASASYAGMNVAGNLTGLTGTANGLKVDGSAVTQPTNITQVGGSSLALGYTSTANAIPVVQASQATSTLSNVNASATNVSLLSSNTARKNACFFNDSSAILYLKLGVTASLTSYTVQILGQSYFELPPGSIYTGQIDGIWSSATGAVRVTELT